MINKAIDKYKKLSLPVKAAFWYTLCNFFNKGIALLSTPIFTRILTEDQYGTFAIFQSWFNILIIFTSLNLFLSGYTKGILKYKQDLNGFTSSQLGLTSVLTFIFFMIYIFNMEFWTNVFELSPLLMLFMFVELLFMPAFEFWMAKERFNYSYKKVVFFSIFMSVFGIGLSIISIYFSNYKLEARVFSDVISKVIIASPLFFLIFFKGKKIFNKEYWKYALAFNIPLIPHYLSNYVLNQSDRIMIGKFVGTSQAAYYSVAYTISMLMFLLVNALNNSLTPYIYKSLDSKKVDKLNKNILPTIVLVALMTLMVMLFAPEIIRIFAGKNYLEAIYIIPPVATSVYFIFIYSLFSCVEYFYQKTSGIAIATTFSALINIILNYIFIKKYGYFAAGYTTLVCYILLSICHYLFYKKIVKNNFSNKTNIYNDKMIFTLGIVLIVLMFIIANLYKFIFIRYALLIIILIIIVIYRNRIIESFKMKGK